MPLTIANGVIAGKRTHLPSLDLSTELTPPYNEVADLLVKGQGVSSNGIFGAQGLLPNPKGWRNDTVTPGGVHVLQTRGGNQVRVYAPSTGDHWGVTVPGDCRGGDATIGGRYLLTYFTPTVSPLMERLLDMVHAIPGVGERLSLPDGYTEYLALYERPGTLRALMPFNEEEMLGGYMDGSTWSFPSPDGHAFVIDSGETCALLRW